MGQFLIRFQPFLCVVRVQSKFYDVPRSEVLHMHQRGATESERKAELNVFWCLH